MLTLQLGKNGITEAFKKELANTLKKKESVKVKILRNSGLKSKEVAERLANELRAKVASTTGNTLILHKAQPL